MSRLEPRLPTHEASALFHLYHAPGTDVILNPSQESAVTTKSRGKLPPPKIRGAGAVRRSPYHRTRESKRAAWDGRGGLNEVG